MNFLMGLGLVLFTLGAVLLFPPMQQRAKERDMRHVYLIPLIHITVGFVTFMVGAFVP